ncbi:MAG: hypothetical protein DRJ02_01860 [Bacteroidetes bacterium]|nr:MAG: hypothetical protein DRI87_04685 [Bacteroidota bacterium]RLD89246.1 MAG: hypothetical protein DRJ02_01860 [Bacteroidota bacterium]
MRKIAILLLLLFSLESIAQTVYERQIKYWYLRDRLRHFIVPSNNPLDDRGSYLVIGSRNNNWPNNYWLTERASYGQQMEFYGYYIGVLATEYYLLKESGEIEEAAKTNSELLLALKAYKRRDLCEELLDPPLPNMLDGFFIRSDVPEDDLFNEDPPQNSFLVNSDLNNENSILISSDQLLDENEAIRVVNYTSNQLPDYFQYENMSQDEAVFLLEGLALTYKFGSLDAKLIALSYAHLVLNRLYGYVSPGLHFMDWNIHNAYGLPIPPGQGGAAVLLSFGYTKIARDFFGFPDFFPAAGSEVVWGALYNGIASDYNQHMIASIAAIGEGWGNLFHLTQHGIYNNTDQDGWDYYYLQLYKALWGRNWNLYNVDRIEDRLDEAPCEGPYCISLTNHPPNGWASPDKWRFPLQEQFADEEIGDIGVYTGLDYMILFNLYFINNVGDRSLYKNYVNEITDQNWPSEGQGSFTNPHIIDVFRSISSADYLKNYPEPADVLYHAGVNIKLLPGFKVESHAHFKAKITPMDYCATPPANRGLQYYPPIQCDNNLFPQTFISSDKIKHSSKNHYYSKSEIKNCKIYPNPSKGIFTVSNPNTIDQFEVYSSYGELIKKENIKDKTFTFDLSSCSSGIYTLILFSKDQTIVKKLVKK